MNFDVRAYCERLAKADPKRFSFESDGSIWLLYDGRFPVLSKSVSETRSCWAFIGPLAEELGIDEIDRECYYDYDEGMQGVTCQYGTLLEAIFAAVVEKLEVKNA